MEVAAATEQRRPIKETPLERLRRETAALVGSLARTIGLSLVLLPLLLAGLLTIDIPVHALDHYASNAVLRPSQWLTRGGVLLALAPMLVVLFARRYGGDVAASVVTTAWTFCALLAFAEIAYLAPQLNETDFPKTQFVIGVVSSAMVSQYVAAGVYDVIRGGGRWWRAPLYALLIAFGIQLVIYYPIVYCGANVPSAHWFVAEFSVKAAMSLGFLALYFLLRHRLKPKRGFGG